MYGSYYSRSWGGSTPKSSGVLTSTSSSTYVKSSGTTVTTYGKKADFLDLTYLDAEKHIPTMPYKEAHEKWPKRESDINTWVDENVYDRVTGELRPDEDVFARAAERGAFLRPGSWVATYVCGQLADAQVYRLPNSFPDGTYIVRVLVPVYDEEGTYSGVEATYLARTIADIVDGDDLYIEATPETSDTEKKEVMVNA